MLTLSNYVIIMFITSIRWDAGLLRGKFYAIIGSGVPFTSYIELVNLSFLYFNNPVLLNITKTCFSILTSFSFSLSFSLSKFYMPILSITSLRYLILPSIAFLLYNNYFPPIIKIFVHSFSLSMHTSLSICSVQEVPHYSMV